MTFPLRKHCKTAEETMAFAKEFSRCLRPNHVVCFFGDLGAGKTTFIKGLVEAVSGLSADLVNSPTFTYLNIYTGPQQTVYHFDLYRLRDVDEFLSMGFDEYMAAGGICCIEWSERIMELLPPLTIVVWMSVSDEGGRNIEISEQ